MNTCDTCDTCKWWEKNTTGAFSKNCQYLEQFGECTRASRGVDLPQLNEAFSFSNEPNLTTGPKFGCIHHERKPAKVLILVLSALREPWGDLMKCAMETWDAVDHPQTQTLYYCASNLSNHIKDERVRYSAMPDTLENISPRTLEAFGWALEIEDWNYLARPNSSCYVHKGNLVKHCETLPGSGVIRGAWTGGAEGQGGFLWGGGQYIISRDVVQRMVAAGDGWRNALMDDEAITRSVQGLGIDTNQGCMFCSIDDGLDGSWKCMTYGAGEPFTFTDFADLKKADGHFFFRVKQEHSRRLDEKLMRELRKNLTP